jgi:hypothetical protein
MEIKTERPPFVRFDYQEYGTDREASEKAGRPIPRTIPFAFITPHGSKDVVERPAEEWLQQVREKAIAGNFNPDWAQRFRMQYDEWMKGNELPRDGCPVKTWVAVNREQINRLLALGITTVEDLAQYPDSSLGMVGLDGRYLRDLAKTWLTECTDKGVNVRRLAELEQENITLKEAVERLQDSVKALERTQRKAA